jgi:NhaA family Na+:H+ antiporter
MAKFINLRPFREFFKAQQLGGILLMVAVLLSLVFVNSALANSFNRILTSTWGLHLSGLHLVYDTTTWINDGLMAIFFLLVGLEIKRELVEGELSSIKKASLPVFAALGGMLVPAAIFLLINSAKPSQHGWGIPMATDIAFALAIVAALGKRVPTSIKIFLAALAIVDDLGAILVIAIFYSSKLDSTYLAYAGGIVALLATLNYFGIKHLIFYLIPGVFLWYVVHHSGIHATIAGVLLACFIPITSVKETSPLEKLERLLLKPVNLIIMPLFALANTNIRLEWSMLKGISSPIGLGIILGLVLGKPIGVFLFSWISVKLGWSRLPSKTTWQHVLGSGMLAGIGFTMSTFIALLSFTNPAFQLEAKFYILIASIIAACIGFSYLIFLHKKAN